MAESKLLSLHDACRAKGFEVAILATYNVSFPFFENVTLRALQAGGCRQIILLADAAQVTAAFEHVERRPTRAGREYLLVPVARARTFHPKVLLQLGRTKTRLMIGSHNVTLAGYGRNIELTTRIDLDRRKRSERHLVQAAWSFLREWIGDLDQPILGIFDAARVTAHNEWIGSGKTSASAGDLSVLGSSVAGPSLFFQLRDALPGPVERVSVLGPYFDADLAFIDQLHKLDGQPEIIVAVDPLQAQLPASAHASAHARFVDLRCATLGPGESKKQTDPSSRRFVHAKALVFEHPDGTKTLVTGSANPSRAAWLLASPKRNAELVVVERNASARVEALGLSELSELPELDAAAWQLLAEREHAQTAEEGAALPQHKLMVVAWLDHAMVTVPASFVVGVEPEQLELIDDQEQCLACANSIERTEGLAYVGFVETTATSQSLCLRNTVTGQRALLQRRAELEGRASGSHRQQFKAALLSLETDAAQLDQLFAIVSKVLSEPVITSHLKAAPKPIRDAKADTQIISFESSIHDGQRSPVIPRGARALAPSSDLAAIIEFLIYQLGVGRETEDADEGVDTSVSEEEISDLKQEGEDLPDEPDDDGNADEQSPPLTGHERAQMCQRKITTLLSRLQKRAAKVGDDGDPLSVIVHTVAVLGVLRHLRVCEPSIPWRPLKASLIPAKKEREFFDKMCPLLYAPETGLVARVLGERDGVLFDEVSSLHSLMTWLAEDCEVDLGAFARMDLRAREIEQRWTILGRALGPLAACAADPNACALVDALAANKAPRETWLRPHLAWSRQGPSGGEIRLGSVVMLPNEPGHHVVVGVQPTKVGLYVLARGKVVFYARAAVDGG